MSLTKRRPPHGLVEAAGYVGRPIVRLKVAHMAPAAVDAVGGGVLAALLDAPVEGADVSTARAGKFVALLALGVLPDAPMLLAEEGRSTPAQAASLAVAELDDAANVPRIRQFISCWPAWKKRKKRGCWLTSNGYCKTENLARPFLNSNSRR